MAVPSYTTDLATVNLCTGTWEELTGSASGSAPTENDTDNFIAGTDSTTEAVRASGLSSMSSPSATITVASGDAVFMWLYFASIPVMELLANGGYRVAIGQDVDNYKMWNVVGRDTLPKGGWFSVAVDPATAQSSVQGTPTAVTAVFGSVISLNTGVSKGNAFANDFQRHGRSLIVTDGDLANGYATFDGASLINDSINNKWGLFEKNGLSYSQKGLFQMGSVATAVDFRDTDVAISVEDTLHVTAGFNEFEVLNIGSNIEWTGITISALGTVSKGKFTVTDDATVSIDGCTFNAMDSFTYKSNSTIVNTKYKGCGLVTQGSASITNCVFEAPSGAICLLADDLSIVTKNTFNSDGTGHAVDLGTVATTQSMSWDNFESGYALTNGVTGNETILVSVASGQVLTINVASGASSPTVYNTGLGTVNVVAGLLPITITVKDGTTGLGIPDANVMVMRSDTKATIISGTTNGSGIYTESVASTFNTVAFIGWARQVDLLGVDYVAKDFSGTISTNGADINVTLEQR